tara:strand:- start:329 stop:505 length:177 start_codon:yes stop_codon:yes gene_type:complete
MRETDIYWERERVRGSERGGVRERDTDARERDNESERGGERGGERQRVSKCGAERERE